MQIGYRCVHCRYVHNDKVSSCDCEISSNGKFEYTEVAIIDLKNDLPDVPDLSELNYTKDEWFVNIPESNTGNGVFAYTGRWQEHNAKFGHETVAHVMGTGIHLDTSAFAERKIERANLVLVSGANQLLEAAYASLAYFQAQARAQGPSKRNTIRQQILIEAIIKATDQSPLHIRHKKEK